MEGTKGGGGGGGGRQGERSQARRRSSADDIERLVDTLKEVSRLRLGGGGGELGLYCSTRNKQVKKAGYARIQPEPLWHTSCLYITLTAAVTYAQVMLVVVVYLPAACSVRLNVVCLGLSARILITFKGVVRIYGATGRRHSALLSLGKTGPGWK